MIVVLRDMDGHENKATDVAATVAAPVAATEAIPVQRIEIVGDRRRAHDAAFRARMVAELRVPGTRVRDLARRNEICASLIYRWRREAAPQVGAASAVRLVPVRVNEGRHAGEPVASPRPPSSSAPAETIEIELDGGVRLRVSDRISTASLRRVVAALRG